MDESVIPEALSHPNRDFACDQTNCIITEKAISAGYHHIAKLSRLITKGTDLGVTALISGTPDNIRICACTSLSSWKTPPGL